MNTPTCPPGYNCSFTPHPPKHIYDPWWTGPVGEYAAGFALGVLLIVLCVTAYQTRKAYEARQDRIKLDHERDRLQVDKREQRQQALEMAEQLTMALDAAQGSPEMLKIVEERMRS